MMVGKQAANRWAGFRRGPIILAVVIIQKSIVVERVPAADSAKASNRTELADLTTAEKIELDAKRERFETLSAAEQQRIRSLHEQLESQPDADRLVRVMKSYDEWLRALSTSQRAELLELPVEQRLARIHQLKQEAARKKFERSTRHRLSREDMDAIHDWLANLVVGREAELEKNISDGARAFLNKLEDGKAKRLWLLRAGVKHKRGVVPLDPTELQIDDLKKKLSNEARSEIDELKTPEEKKQHVLGWIRAAMFSRMSEPPVNREELDRFFKELDSTRREELERLPPERFQRELKAEYFRDQFNRRFGDRMPRGRPPFGPPDHDRDRDFDPDRHRRDPPDGPDFGPPRGPRGPDHRPPPPEDDRPPD